MEKEYLEFSTLIIILCGIAVGSIARCVTLRIDSRQIPTYPNGYFINLVTGFIAACLGAVAIPALLANNFTAVTFLALAIQHFRDVRQMEQESMSKLEKTEYTNRGNAYIDGIAKTYESRNYISLITALVAVLAATASPLDSLLINAGIAGFCGIVSIFVLVYFTRGATVADICEIREAKISIENGELFVDDIWVTSSLGTEMSRKFFQKEAFAVVLIPHEEKHRLILENVGQRQAILFEAIRAYGVKRFQFTRRSFEDGRVAIAFVPTIRNEEGILAAIGETPIMESSRKVRRKLHRKGK